MASGTLIWAHHDSSDLGAYARRAWECGMAQSWPSGGEGNRLLRAWLVSIAHVIAALGPRPMAPLGEGDSVASGLGVTGELYVALVEASTVPIRSDFQAHLATCLGAVASRGKRTKEQVLVPSGRTARIVTTDGEAPRIVSPAESAEAGAIGIVAGVVIVACTGILAGALGWITSQAAEVLAIDATAQSKTTAAIGAMTTAANVVELHLAREEAQGQSIPWTAEEQELLATLRQSIRDTAGWDPPPMRSVPNVAGASTSIGAGIGIGTALAIALAAWLFLRKEK